MLIQFGLENLRFAINLFAALVFFAIYWLYFDAWKESSSSKEFARFFGFLFLAASFLGAATLVEAASLAAPSNFVLASNVIRLLTSVGRLVGYGLIALSLQLDPIPKAPRTEGLTPKGLTGVKNAFAALPIGSLVFALYPILAGWIGFAYFQRATRGLERHLGPISFGFFALALSELASLGEVFRSSENVDLYNFVAPFGPLWIIKNVLLVIAITVLGRWVFSYLLKRFTTQLFIVFASSTLIIFLITTVAFTFLLLTNLQRETLNRLSTDVGVLNYAIETKKAQAVSTAQLVAQNSGVLVSFNDPAGLSRLLEDFLVSKESSLLWVVDINGIVKGRGENSERFGDSISDDPLFLKAVSGEPTASLVSKGGALAPSISIRAGYPITAGGTIVGVAIAGEVIDNAFVDGMKSATNLATSVYGGNQLSATTLLTADGKNRPLGTVEDNSTVKTRVLEKGESYTGTTSIFNVPYFAGYLPLKDVEGRSVGMLFVGEPQLGVLELASYSIQMTFIVSVVLLSLSLFPSFAISKYLQKQLGA